MEKAATPRDALLFIYERPPLHNLILRRLNITAVSDRKKSHFGSLCLPVLAAAMATSAISDGRVSL